jgi:hypothetical protein
MRARVRKSALSPVISMRYGGFWRDEAEERSGGPPAIGEGNGMRAAHEALAAGIHEAGGNAAAALDATDVDRLFEPLE